MRPHYIPYRNLLWIIPLVAIEFWFLANPPAWWLPIGKMLGNIGLIALFIAGCLLWIGFCRLVATILFGVR